MRKFYEVPKRILLIIAGIVWMIAGFNVARLGVLAYGLIEPVWYLFLLCSNLNLFASLTQYMILVDSLFCLL